MSMPLRCRCGKVKGAIDPACAYTRGTCYCVDCQAYARYLGGADLMDANGGSDVVPMAPAGYRITEGAAHLACMSLSPKGLLRWYADCCRTPLGNMPRGSKLPYIGVPVVALDAAPTLLDECFGRGDAVVLNVGAARGTVKPTRLALLRSVCGIMAGVAREFLAGRAKRPNVFIDAEGQPTTDVQVLTLAQRKALSAG